MGEEYGGVGNWGFAKSTLYDSEGKVVEEPKCEKCGEIKNCFIGKESYAWLCMFCPPNEPK